MTSATLSITITRSRTNVVVPFIPFLALFVLAWLQLRRGGTYYAIWAQDIFLPLEAVLHMQQGDRPHVDFQSPIGYIYLLIHYATTWLAPVSAETIVYANTLAGIAIAAIAWAVARSRLPVAFAAVFTFYIGLTAASPRQLGQFLNYITYNAMYNRFGWAAIGVLCLVAALPRTSPSNKSTIYDGVMTGLLLFIVFYIKITYFLVGAAVVVIAIPAMRRSAPWRYLAALVLSWTALMLLMEGCTGSTLAYLHDLRTAALVQPDPIRISQFLSMAQGSLVGTILVMVTGVLATRPGERTIETVSRIAAAGAVVGAGVLLGTQNYLALENPLIPVAALVACYGAGRSPAMTTLASAGTRTAKPRWSALPLALPAWLFLQPVVLDTLAAVWTSVAPVTQDASLGWLQSTPLRNILLAEDSSQLRGDDGDPAAQGPAIQNDLDYFTVLADGAALLRRHLSGSATVLPLTWTNPFPVLLGLLPVRHELLWWDAHRTFSAEIKPDAASLFKDVGYVMIPKMYYNYGATTAMQQAYAHDLDVLFTKVDETRFWTLLERR